MDRLERISELLKLLWCTDQASPATAIAAITTLLDPSLCYSLWKRCGGYIETKGFPNDDALAVATCLYLGSQDKAAPQRTNNEWALLQLVLSPESTVKGVLSRIFQVFGWDDDSVHRGLLLDLLETRHPNANELKQILLMLEALEQALKSIKVEMVAGLKLDPESDAEELGRILSLLRDFIIRCQPISARIANKRPNLALAVLACEHDRQLRGELEMLLGEAAVGLFAGSMQKRYRDALTVTLKTNDPADVVLRDALADLDAKWSEIIRGRDPTIAATWEDIQPTILLVAQPWAEKTIYVYHDALIRRAITEALSNVMHRSEKIVCPWTGNEALGVADMWARISCGEAATHVILELSNAIVSKNISPRPPSTFSTLHLRNIGGDVQFRTDANRDILYTEIRIPTVSGLAWQRPQS